MIGFYNYTVILTYISLLSSMAGIFFACSGHPFAAIVCLMVSGLCDMFDGKVARTRKRTEEEKSFGIQIDSLCDVVCFGVLPAVIGFSLRADAYFLWPVWALYPLCAVIRLGYFNVTEEARQHRTDEVRKTYLGLPVTSSAIILPLVFLLHRRIDWFPALYACVLVLIALCFLCPFHLRKPHKKGVLLLLGAGLVEFALLLLFHVFG